MATVPPTKTKTAVKPNSKLNSQVDAKIVEPQPVEPQPPLPSDSESAAAQPEVTRPVMFCILLSSDSIALILKNNPNTNCTWIHFLKQLLTSDLQPGIHQPHPSFAQPREVTRLRHSQLFSRHILAQTRG